MLVFFHYHKSVTRKFQSAIECSTSVNRLFGALCENKTTKACLAAFQQFSKCSCVHFVQFLPIGIGILKTTPRKAISVAKSRCVSVKVQPCGNTFRITYRSQIPFYFRQSLYASAKETIFICTVSCIYIYIYILHTYNHSWWSPKITTNRS